MNHYQDISVRRVIAELVDDPAWPDVVTTPDAARRPRRPRDGRDATASRGRAASAATACSRSASRTSPGYCSTRPSSRSTTRRLITSLPARTDWYHAEGCGHLSVEAFWQMSKVVEVRYDRFLALGDAPRRPARGPVSDPGAAAVGREPPAAGDDAAARGR